mgnify:CR=1 FL=1
MGPGPGGPGRRGPMGPKPKIENPGKLFKRLMTYMFQNYLPHVIVVVICIFLSVFASIRGTMFMQTLIDGYITPMIGQANPDFSGTHVFSSSYSKHSAVAREYQRELNKRKLK